MSAIIKVFALNAEGQLDLQPQEIPGMVVSCRSFGRHDYLPRDVRPLAAQLAERGIVTKIMKTRISKEPKADQSHLRSFIRPDKRIYGEHNPLVPVQFESIDLGLGGGSRPITVYGNEIAQIREIDLRKQEALNALSGARDMVRTDAEELKKLGVGPIFLVTVSSLSRPESRANFHFVHLHQAHTLRSLRIAG